MDFAMDRRHFLAGSAAFLATPAVAQDAVGFDETIERLEPQGPNPWGLHPRLMPTRIVHKAGMVPGHVHVDPIAKYLYHILDDGTAMRYGVAVGRSGLQAPGQYTIRRKVEWPSWQPTAAMIAREPDLYAEFASGVPGGPENPLGARALYLYDGDRDSYLRIHGTPQPWSIGTSASSGCVRMVNAHVIELYEKLPIGTVVHLHRPNYAITGNGTAA